MTRRSRRVLAAAGLFLTLLAVGVRFTSPINPLSESAPRLLLAAFVLLLAPGGFGCLLFRVPWTHPLQAVAVSFAFSCALSTAFALPVFLSGATIDAWIGGMLGWNVVAALVLLRGGEARQHKPTRWGGRIDVETALLGALTLLLSTSLYWWADELTEAVWEVALHLVYVRQYASGLSLGLSEALVRPGFRPPNLFFLWELLLGGVARLSGLDAVVAFLRSRCLIPLLSIAAFLFMASEVLGSSRRATRATLVVVLLAFGQFLYLQPFPPGLETLFNPLRQVAAFTGSLHHGETAIDILLPLMVGLLFGYLRCGGWLRAAALGLGFVVSFFWHPREYFQVMWYGAIAGAWDLGLRVLGAGSRLPFRRYVVLAAIFIAVALPLAWLTLPTERASPWSSVEVGGKAALARDFVSDLGKPSTYFEAHGPFRFPFHGSGKVRAETASSTNYFSWMAASVVFLPALIVSGTRRELWLAGFYLTLWWLTLCYSKSRELLVLATYSEILTSQVRFLFVFAFLLIAVELERLVQLLAGLAATMGLSGWRRTLGVVSASLAIGLGYAAFWPGTAAGLSSRVWALTMVFVLCAIGILGRLCWQPAVPRRSGALFRAGPVIPWALAVSVLAIVLPASHAQATSFLSSALSTRRDPLALFRDGNPTEASALLIRHLRERVAPRSVVLVTPFRRADPAVPFAGTLAIYAPLYQIPLLGNVIPDAPQWDSIAAGTHPVFNRRTAEGECDPKPAHQFLVERRIEYVVATGAFFDAFLSCFVEPSPSAFQVEFENRLARERLVKVDLEALRTSLR